MPYLQQWLVFMLAITGILLAVTLWFLIVPIAIAAGTVFVSYIIAKLYMEDKNNSNHHE